MESARDNRAPREPATIRTSGMPKTKTPPKASPTVPRKRRQRRKEARPAEIIEAGIAEFATNGFARTRLDDVAKRAGVAKGTIYLYFPDKEALFVSAVRSRVAPLLEQMGQFADGFEGSSADLLENVIRTAHARMLASDLSVLIRILIAEGAAFPQLTEFYYRESISKARALLERIVRRGVKSGEFREGPAARLSMVLMAPVIMAAVWKMTFDRHAPVSPKDFLEAHLDLALGALCKSR